ncbi:MAG: peptidase S41 [Desulfuromonas sp.]|nr:MAG: peptidase S41 [Desulfuromonas sp.]
MHRKNGLLVTLICLVVLAGWISFAGGQTRTARSDSPYEEMKIFTDVLSIVRESYVEEVGLPELIYGAIDGMLATLDPHSSFMDPEMYSEMKTDTKGEFGGLGIEISIRDGILTIIAPIEDTPADRVGLAAGDQIVRIDDQLTKEIGIMEAVKLLRGPKGSQVTVTIMRDSFDRPQPFTIERELIKIESVKARTLEDGYGYIRLSQFQENTDDDLGSALEHLRKENGGQLKGLILDMRNNPGGLLEQAVRVSDHFLDKGLIVYTEGREAASEMKFEAHRDGTEPDYPVVILINSGSASAAEIVAGALKDHRRAILLGTRSFGKGSVQTIIPLEDGSGLRLTTARYFTPSGTSIQALGIEPDILVNQVTVEEKEGGAHLREKDLENHFDNGDLDHADSSVKFRLGKKDRDDYQLVRALDLLKGWDLFQSIQKPAA